MGRRSFYIDLERKSPIPFSVDERRVRFPRRQLPRRFRRGLFRRDLLTVAQRTRNELRQERFLNALFVASHISGLRHSRPTRYSPSPLQNPVCFAKGLATFPTVLSAPDTCANSP